MNKFLILVFCFFISCKDETVKEAVKKKSSKKEVVAEPILSETNANYSDPLCDDNADMIAALPIENEYKKYQLVQTICNPRSLFYKFQHNKYKKQFLTISIWDCSEKKYNYFLEDAKTNHSKLIKDTLNQKTKSRRTSNLKATKFGYLLGYKDVNVVEKSKSNYVSVIKNNYYLNIFVKGDTLLAQVDSLEKFIKPFVFKINASKLN